MKFIILDRGQHVPSSGQNTAYLQIDYWNDYSFVTMFNLTLHDEAGGHHELGCMKIGFKGQDVSQSTYENFKAGFNTLQEGYFSLGQDLDYYRKIATDLTTELQQELLVALRDVTFDPLILESALHETVFGTSLLRGISLSTVRGQFKRVLEGGVPLTDFTFAFKREQSDLLAGIDLNFFINSQSKPSTNIHAIIGRNGVGKTTLLNGMIQAITNRDAAKTGFYDLTGFENSAIGADYFSSLVSVSFSAFDPFNPPAEQSNPALGTCYFYIGLKDINGGLKTLPILHEEFLDALNLCFSQSGKKSRWLKAIGSLESDENFAAMNLQILERLSGDEFKRASLSLISRMSSGHAVVLLTITKLVATVEEKTLVLIDEPESHLHPPLLSAFVRALCGLLYDRNGVAIMATHSPVVLQEIPQSCVWKVFRSRLTLKHNRPDNETFGENVGTLTRDVFGLEVVKSGFHQLLEQSVAAGGTFDEISTTYDHQLGIEAKAILRTMILHRDAVAQR